MIFPKPCLDGLRCFLLDVRCLSLCVVFVSSVCLFPIRLPKPLDKTSLLAEPSVVMLRLQKGHIRTLITHAHDNNNNNSTVWSLVRCDQIHSEISLICNAYYI